VQVDLHDLGAGARADVRDRQLDGESCGVGRRVTSDGEAVVFKVGVRQAVAEREVDIEFVGR